MIVSTHTSWWQKTPILSTADPERCGYWLHHWSFTPSSLFPHMIKAWLKVLNIHCLVCLHITSTLYTVHGYVAQHPGWTLIILMPQFCVEVIIHANCNHIPSYMHMTTYELHGPSRLRCAAALLWSSSTNQSRSQPQYRGADWACHASLSFRWSFEANFFRPICLRQCKELQKHRKLCIRTATLGSTTMRIVRVQAL